ncbi:hypothetical protein GZ172_01440, partial [Dermatophilus congolensis]|nr:hypothetical protein [Dermatophilus congolensis]MBO3216578.1 hypothetical protein [Dermatophilus congolensis]
TSPTAPLPPLPEDGPTNPPNRPGSPGHQDRPNRPTNDSTSTNPTLIPPRNIIDGPTQRWGKGNAEGIPSSAWHLPTPNPTWRTGHVSPHTTAVPNTPTSAHHQSTAETRTEPPIAATLLTLIVTSGAIAHMLSNRRKRTCP